MCKLINILAYLKKPFFIPLFDRILIASFIIVGIIYVANAWSPSSYSIALKQLQAKNSGLIFGWERGDRQDEWGNYTPLIQATINNNFERYNKTSFYSEDLRMYLSLPVFDWGMIFKPTMWLFRFIHPAYAFSFHHYSLIVLFIYGYTLLFRLFSMPRIYSFLASLLLFFSGWQFWWTIPGPIFAIFPWLIIPVYLRIHPFLKLLLFYWIGTCWILSHFYPPLLISFSFIAFFVFVSLNDGLAKNLKIVGCLSFAAAASSATAIFYLKDYFLSNLNTLYPGQGYFWCGGGVNFTSFLSQFLPTLQFHYNPGCHYALAGANICETGGFVGSYYIFCTLCFLNYKNIYKICPAIKRIITILLIGLTAMYCWALLPIPSYIGKIFLWNYVSPYRMMISIVFLLLLICFISASSLGLKISTKRLIVFIIIVFAGFYLFKYSRYITYPTDLFSDFGIIIPLILFPFIKRYFTKLDDHFYVLIASLLFAFLIYGIYNPIQSSWPIFNREKTPVTNIFDQIVAKNPDKTLAVSNLRGAILNGFGYKSVSHILVVPMVNYWTGVFPEIDKEKLNFIFNRYVDMILTHEKTPRLLTPFVVSVPIDRFCPELNIKRGIRHSPFMIMPLKMGGSIESIVQEGNKTIITGWAPWIDISKHQVINIISKNNINKANLNNIQRFDIATKYNDVRLLYSGFVLEISWAENIKNPVFNLVAEDKITGNITLLKIH